VVQQCLGSTEEVIGPLSGAAADRPQGTCSVPWSQTSHVLRCQAATSWAVSFQATASS
jgi:hypothetical protein